MPFFKTKCTHQTALKTMAEAKKIIEKEQNQSEKSIFLQMLEKRIEDFESALKEKHPSNQREEIIEQYNRFSKTLLQCLSHPKSTSLYIRNYHNIGYYPVGIYDQIKPDPLKNNISIGTAAVGAMLILASFAAFGINPLIGTILLPIGITLLAPACAYLMTPDSVDTTAMKCEEQIIFQMGAQIINPDLCFDEPDKVYESAYAK